MSKVVLLDTPAPVEPSTLKVIFPEDDPIVEGIANVKSCAGDT